MEFEIQKLEIAVADLTTAVKRLAASIKAQKPQSQSPAAPQSFPTLDYSSMDLPQTVCSDTDCGVINSGTTTCDHTFARYRSEYFCG